MWYMTPNMTQRVTLVNRLYILLLFLYQTVTYAGYGITQHLYSYTICINFDFVISFELRSLRYSPVSKAFVKSRDHACLFRDTRAQY